MAAGDLWVSAWVRMIVKTRAYRAGHTALFLTFDEGSNRNGHIATVVVSPYTRRARCHTGATALLAHADHRKRLGIRRCLGKACSARGLSKAFRL